jgi:hypothetical protein
LENEIEYFERKSGIKDNHDYVLHRGISLETLDERHEHKKALDEFNRYCERRGCLDIDDWLIYTAEPHIDHMAQFIFLAHEIRECRKKEPASANSFRLIQAEHNVLVEPDTVSPPIFIAASTEKKKSALEMYNEGKPLPEPDFPEDVNINNPKAISDPIVETLEKTNAILERFHSKPIQIQFYPDDTPPDKIPDFVNDGFFVPLDDYVIRIGGKPSAETLTGYREVRHNPVQLPDGIIKIKGGHYCRQTGDKSNSPFEFFVRYSD